MHYGQAVIIEFITLYIICAISFFIQKQKPHNITCVQKVRITTSYSPVFQFHTLGCGCNRVSSCGSDEQQCGFCCGVAHRAQNQAVHVLAAVSSASAGSRCGSVIQFPPQKMAAASVQETRKISQFAFVTKLQIFQSSGCN